MKSAFLLCFAAIIACVSARVYISKEFLEKHPEYKWSKTAGRHTRDVTWVTKDGRGKLFGILGSTDNSIFGKAGYKQDFFNDNRGHLQGQAYGSRVLSTYGDSSVFGGKLDWNNNNAKAALDVHKEIGRGSGMTLSGDGRWKLDKNTEVSAGGNLHKTFGHDKPEIGVQAQIEHKW